jgi:lipoprotein signal peptidase
MDAVQAAHHSTLIVISETISITACFNSGVAESMINEKYCLYAASGGSV